MDQYGSRAPSKFNILSSLFINFHVADDMYNQALVCNQTWVCQLKKSVIWNKLNPTIWSSQKDACFKRTRIQLLPKLRLRWELSPWAQIQNFDQIYDHDGDNETQEWFFPNWRKNMIWFLFWCLLKYRIPRLQLHEI